MHVLEISVKHYVFLVMGAINLTLALGVIYAHFTDRVRDTITDGEFENIVPEISNSESPENKTFLRPGGSIIEYIGGGCDEQSPFLMTLTHTFAALTPTKWILRLVVANSMFYIGILMPWMEIKMFREKVFVETSNLSESLIKFFSFLAAFSTTVGYISALGVTFCLDIYQNNDENAPTVVDARTPKWHWELHMGFYICMVCSYVVHNISVCVLYLTNPCPEMARKHNKWIKIVMAFCSAVFGPASIYYLFADFFWCQDNLSFYFSVFEYLFVFSCFVLIAEMSRYYWDKSIVVRLDGKSNGCECDDPEGSRFPLNQSVTSE